MLGLIKGLSDNSELLRDAKDLRKVERAVRNAAAHDIVSVTESWIKERTEKVRGGMTPRQIFKLLQRMCRFAGLPSNEEIWKSYDKMNSLIFEHLDRKAAG